MQEIPGFGAIISDNPIVAEVLTGIAYDQYPEGNPEGRVATTFEESEALLRQSAILDRIGGLDLVMEFANELRGLSVHPIEMMLDPLAHLGAAFMIGVKVGAELERRARFDNGPDIDWTPRSPSAPDID